MKLKKVIVELKCQPSYRKLLRIENVTVVGSREIE